MRPWYLPTWVKSATPVTSPAAQTFFAGDEPVVDRDALPLEGEVEVLEPEAVDVRPAARGDEQALRLHRLPAVELQAERRLAASLDAGRLRVEAEVDALFPQPVGEDRR